METIHKNLVLDHLYFGTTDEEFEDIKSIFLQLGCAKHEVVDADTDSWEGVYISTRGQYYLEILKRTGLNTLGLAQKAFSPIAQDARLIANDFPELPWKRIERTRNGVKWFTALTCDELGDKSPFYTWVMYYHKRDNYQVIELKNFEIARIGVVRFRAHPGLIDYIKTNSKWLNSTTTFSENECLMKIQTYYSDDFELQILFDSATEGIKFQETTFLMQDGFRIDDIKLQHFELSNVGNWVTLKKTK